MQIHPFQIMAKPAGSICNLDCHYCFYLAKPHLAQRHMDFDLLERYIESYIRQAPQQEVTFLWQGGEPTLAGIDFYRQAVKLQQRYANGKKIYNALQTNGVLLNSEWVDFLREHQFLVGLSIDGTEAMHDAYRVSKSQKGTFKQVMAALNLLKQYQIDFNTLTVVHKANVQSGAEVYQFLREIGSTYMQFIPLMGEWEQKATAKDYGKMMRDIFDQWYPHDIGRIGVQFIEQWLMAYLGLEPSLCIFRKACGDQMIIEQNGDLYSCDHYVYPEYKLGNLIETPLRDMTYSSQQQRFGKMKSQLSQRCQQCRFQFACHGGCPKHRTVQGFGEPHNQLCEAYYSTLEYLDPYLKQLANYLKQQHKYSH